jgi:hypothetical protein
MINNRQELREWLNRSSRESLVLTVLRAGQPISATVNLAEAASVRPTSPWPSAFSRRNYQLGITLSQFRSLPYPDEPPALPVCTDEVRASSFLLAGLLLSDDWKRAGVVMCGFFRASGLFGVSARLTLGNVDADTHCYFIRNGDDAEPRLFLVKSSGPTVAFEGLTQSFTVAVGKAPQLTTAQVQTKAGAMFQNDIATWENDVSFIRLERYGGTTELFSLTHALKPLMTIFDKKLAAVAAADAKKL